MQDQDGRRRVAEAEERTKRAESPSAKSKQSRAEIPSAKNKQSENFREGQRDDDNIGEDAQQSASKRKREECEDPNTFDIGEEIDKKKWKAFVEKHGLKIKDGKWTKEEDLVHFSADAEEGMSRKAGVQRSAEQDQDNRIDVEGPASAQKMRIEQKEGGQKRNNESDENNGGLSKAKKLNMFEKQFDKQIKELLAVDVAEIFSPRRVNEFASEYELIGGWSLDLTTLDEEGKPWDFSSVQMRNKAARKVLEEKPTLLIGSPPCTYFSRLMSITWSRMNPEEAWAKWNQAIEHLNFCMHLYKIQINAGRIFYTSIQ